MAILSISHTMKVGEASAEEAIKRNRNCSKLRRGFRKRQNNTVSNSKNVRHRLIRKLKAGSGKYFELFIKYLPHSDMLYFSFVVSGGGKIVDMNYSYSHWHPEGEIHHGSMRF